MKNDETEPGIGSTNKGARRAYSSPQCTRFGRVRQLTTSGTGAQTENKPGMGSGKKMS